MSFSTRTSGDPGADRRYAYADGARAEGDLVAARDLFEQALGLAPNWPPTHFALGQVCLDLGDHVAARAALRTCLALDPEDRLGASVLLAALEGSTAMPDAYVKGLFDEYAARFDRHLVEALDYSAPARIAALLGEGRFSAAIDLGCGTGLMARALQGRCARMVGVDLSPNMLAEAAKTGLYARLHAGELLAFLADETEQVDLVLAADVFCYVPDLGPVFRETARLLEPTGLFAFSIQTHAGDGVVIGEDRRVHHAPALVRGLAREAGLVVRHEIAASTRKDRGRPVPGALFLLAKP